MDQAKLRTVRGAGRGRSEPKATGCPQTGDGAARLETPLEANARHMLGATSLPGPDISARTPQFGTIIAMQGRYPWIIEKPYQGRKR